MESNEKQTFSKYFISTCKNCTSPNKLINKHYIWTLHGTDDKATTLYMSDCTPT